MATKKYESLRIMSLEGSVLYKNEGFTATKDGKPDPKAFRGVLDESLDTLKLAEVYDRHKSELAYPYLDGKPTLIAIDVSFRENSGYIPVEKPIAEGILGKYFKYDADMRSYTGNCTQFSKMRNCR